MGDVIGARAPVWLRIIAALALLWNLVGVWSYLGSVGIVPPISGDMADAAPMPAWVTAAYAVSVLGGAVGSLGLLMLKRWAKPLLLLSLLALLVQDVWAFVLSEADMAGNLALPVAINLIAILLVWLAYAADRKGWLG